MPFVFHDNSHREKQDILKLYFHIVIVTLGGEATNPILKRAPWAGYAMSKARAHIGVDSGYMHLAQCFFKPKDIYIYTNRPWDKWEHHLKMFKDNGVNINEYN